jgi:hypothetical protein
MNEKADKAQNSENDEKNRQIIGGTMKSNVVSIGSQDFSSLRGRTVRKDHEEAVRTFAVESYLLGEMSEDQQITFEQHCMDCEICAEGVEAGRVFISNIAPLPEPEAVPPAHWFAKLTPASSWLKPAGLVAVLLLPIVGWQQFVIAELSGVHGSMVILAQNAQKSTPENEPVRRLTTDSATIQFDVSAYPGFGFYRVNINGGTGRSFSQILPAPDKAANHSLYVQVLRKTLGSGHFSAFVEGLDRENSNKGQKLNDVYTFDLQ